MSQESIEQAFLEDLLPQPPTSRLPRPPLTLSASHFPPRPLPTREIPPATRRSTAENCSGEYLHIRFMRRHAQTPTLPKTEERQPKTEERPPTEGGFTRTRNLRVASTGKPLPQQYRETKEQSVRPGTSHSSEKTAFFDELLSCRQGLRELRVMSHIGKGAFSVVSMAVGREGKGNFAVKAYERLDALDWNRLACIKREVRHLRALDNERVVKLHHLARQHKKLYLVMENAGKQSLAGLLRKEKRLPETAAKKYFREILEGVAYCHGQGVCHRDLKPQNILIDHRGSIKLIDFGFSASTNATLTSFCGTPAYMSPELVKRLPYNGAKADVWALGVILYLMLVGVLPFRAPNEQELFRLIASGKLRYRDESAASPPAKKLIARMVALSPEQRPPLEELLLDPWVQAQQ